jgi:hypothetical protein
VTITRPFKALPAFSCDDVPLRQHIRNMGTEVDLYVASYSWYVPYGQLEALNEID